ncbi:MULTISPECIES: hypothetical protein [unclassified Burkholderia]|uniref:hypothetical protein n=1 Tax=unclassified Burkholderia TaxID=2613784 RepID=UPI000B1F879A|nr:MULTISPECIES: hypothetical protein [unclassified Burkholderia]
MYSSRTIAAELAAQPNQSLDPAHTEDTPTADAKRVDAQSRPRKQYKRKPPIPVSEYSVSYTLDPEHPIWPLDKDGIADGAPYPLSMIAAGALVLCPKHRKRHGVSSAVGYKGGPAEGVLCPSCKHIYYIVPAASEQGLDASS